MPAVTAQERKPYLRVFNGNIVQRAQPNEDEAVSRVNKNGDTVWEFQHEAWRGKIVDVQLRVGNFGKELIIELDDAFLTVPYSGSHSKGLLYRLPVIEPGRTITFQPYMFEGSDKKMKHGWTILDEDGNTIKEYFDREDVPSMEQKTVRGEEVWDDTEQLDWLCKNSLVKWRETAMGTSEYEEIPEQTGHDETFDKEDDEIPMEDDEDDECPF